jgi:hypothetical protein
MNQGLVVLGESKIIGGQGFEVVAEDIGEGRGSNRLAGLNQERVSREAIDLLVELVIGEAELREVLCASGEAHEIDLLAETVLRLDGPGCGDSRGGGWFQNQADGEEVLNLAAGIPVDVSGTIEEPGDKALVMEVLESAIHGSLGHAELFRKPGFEEALTGPKLAGEDLQKDCVPNLIRFR